MAQRRTTIELDEDLLRAAQAATGDTIRGTVEGGLRLLLAEAERAAGERRRSVREHLARAAQEIDEDPLLSDEAWR